MNRLKEIYLTVFTFPRYTLWKRTRKDNNKEFITYFVVCGFFAVLTFIDNYKYLDRFFPFWILYMALFFIAEFLMQGVKHKGDKS